MDCPSRRSTVILRWFSMLGDSTNVKALDRVVQGDCNRTFVKARNDGVSGGVRYDYGVQSDRECRQDQVASHGSRRQSICPSSLFMALEDPRDDSGPEYLTRIFDQEEHLPGPLLGATTSLSGQNSVCKGCKP